MADVDDARRLSGIGPSAGGPGPLAEAREREGDLCQRNEELLRLNRSLEDFTQMVSHDLRAPLRHVAALATFLREDAEGPLPEPVDRRLTQIEERVEAMRGLIDGLLAYARSGAAGTEASPVDLQALVSDAVDLVGRRDGIEISVQADIGPVTTHAVPLSTCIRNLVDNAVTHHPGPDGRVTVRAWRQGDDLLVTVADDGGGIDPVDHDRIFRPMQSLGPGSGLGLSTIRRILDERGGSITVDSEVGRGSAFTITWPAEASPARTSPTQVE